MRREAELGSGLVVAIAIAASVGFAAWAPVPSRTVALTMPAPAERLARSEATAVAREHPSLGCDPTREPLAPAEVGRGSSRHHPAAGAPEDGDGFIPCDALEQVTEQPAPPRGAPLLPSRSSEPPPVPPHVAEIRGQFTLNGRVAVGGVAWSGISREGYGRVDGAGLFVLRNVEPGIVRLRPDPDHAWAFGCEAIWRVPEERWPSVRVDAGERLVHDLTLTIPTGLLTGRVWYEDGSPAPALDVRLLIDGTRRQPCPTGPRTRTDLDGRFRIEAPLDAASFGLRIEHGGAVFVRRGFPPNSQGVDIVAPRPMALAGTALDTPGSQSVQGREPR